MKEDFKKVKIKLHLSLKFVEKFQEILQKVND
jgi:hypothetical protein